MPRFPVPDGRDRGVLAGQGGRARAARRASRSGVPDGHREQADYEVGVICQMGFPGYFLVVADFISYAKSKGIRVGPGRGSARGLAGRVRAADHRPRPDRARPDLRALPQPRPRLDARHRHRLRRAPARRGDPLRHREVRRGAGRPDRHLRHDQGQGRRSRTPPGCSGYPFALGDRITKAMPPAVMGKDIPLAGHLRPGTRPLRRGRRVPGAVRGRRRRPARSSTPRAGLEGLKRQWGVHAAGVIMSSEPLIDVIPIQRREQDGAIITQFDMGACETLGLLKMDFLGLRNLTVLDDCLVNITSQPRRGGRPRGRSASTTARPTSCWPAATPSASSSSTAGRCARCCARCSRTTSRTSPRSSRSTGPARWAPTPTTTTPTARTAASRSCRSTPSWPSRSPRSSATPTA